MTSDPYDLSASRIPTAPAPSTHSQSAFSPGLGGSNLNSGSSPLSGGPSGQSIVVTRPPLLLLCVALLTAVIGLTAALFFGSIGWLAIVSWLLSGLVTLSLLATFTSVDNGRRASLFYAVSTAALVLYWVTLAVALAGIIISAWHIADWIGRL